MGDVIVLTPAGDVEAGDYVWRKDELFRCYEVEHVPLRHLVVLRLEACRYGDWTRDETDLVPVERMT